MKYVVENKEKQSIKYHPKSTNLFICSVKTEFLNKRNKQINHKGTKFPSLDVEIPNGKIWIEYVNIYNRKVKFMRSIFKQLFVVEKFQINAFEFPLLLPRY